MKLPCTLSLVLLCILIGPTAGVDAQADGESPRIVIDDGCGLWSERDTGFWVSAEALLWNRTQSTGGGTIIGGPESLEFGNQSYTYEGGYRLGLGWLIDPNYEVEGIWTQFHGWNAGSSGFLSHAISFDGGETSLSVDPSGAANFINRSTFFRSLYDSATDALSGGANDETAEFEFMQPGSVYTMHQTSALEDGQVNMKTRRALGQRFRWGLGYRDVLLSEGSQVGITGTFDAFDVDGDEATTNEPNDKLSGQALLAQGLTLLNGTGDFNDPSLGGGVFTMFWNGTTRNQMNGVQGVVEGTLLERGRFSLDGNLRTGILYNRVQGTVFERYADSVDSIYTRQFTDTDDRISFVSNLGLNAVIRLAERVRIRTGYEVMFLTNVALGPSQQQGLTYDGLGNASYAVQGNDTVILNGFNAGLELDW